MSNEPLFRFTAFRGAKEKLRSATTRTRFQLYAADTDTPFLKSFLDAQARGATRVELAALGEALKSTPRYVRDIHTLPLDVGILMAWGAKNAHKQITKVAFTDEFEALYRTKLDDLVKGAAFRDSLGALADTILADALSARREESIEDVTTGFKLLTLGDRNARREVLPFNGRLGDFIAKVTIVVPSVTGPARQPRPPAKRVPPSTAPAASDPLRDRMHDLSVAHRELTRLALDPRSMTEVPNREPPKTMVDTKDRRIPEPTGPEFDAGGEDAYLSEAAVASLSASTQKILVDMRFSPKRVDPFIAVRLIEEETSHLGTELAGKKSPSTQLMLGSLTVDTAKFKKALGFDHVGKPVLKLKDKGCGYSVGVGDLLMVQQKLKAYEVAEFAHVENVLAGEEREREHRRLDLSEVIDTTETEREVEKERDLQSTERNEMQSEASKTVKDQFSLEAGTQVSGSYGPTLSFTASMNASYSTSIEETQKRATSYSREVTEKAAERTRERVRNETRVRVLHQIEEINKHVIKNPTTDHVRGIYRWLNKIYDAQVFNYGKRMMYEFVIPEPAAFLLWALVEDPPTDVEIEKPEPPCFPFDGGKQPLHPSHLTRHNYHDYVAQYRIPNVPPPPPEFTYVSYFDKQDAGEKAVSYGRAGKLEIPDGYAAVSARVHSSHTHTDEGGYGILLGGRFWPASKQWVYSAKDIASREKEMSISYLLWKTGAFSLGVDVRCQLTAEGRLKWQHAVYDAIINAYQQQKAVYDDRVAQAKLQRGPQVFGRNPLENRRMERDELKKLAIEMLIGNNYLNIDSIDLNGTEPVMDLDSACPNGSYIRFFENAFEWNNMLYVLYPYFWSRHVRWAAALHLSDVDSDFAAFLKAGAARVQVPVRPGFERALAHFCQFGKIWAGNDAPLMEDELYVPIIDEITESLGKPEAPPEPYPADSKPWEVTVPTSLVILQNLEEVPSIRDILTGNPITIVKNV